MLAHSHALSRARRRASVTAGALLALGLASACSAPAADDGRLQVLASFYPLQYVVEQVGGDLVDVTSLTPAGAEPHDLELSPAHTRTVGTADLVVYLSGFQPAVDDAIAARDPEHALDAADVAALTSAEHETEHAEDAEDAEHAEHAEEDHDAHDHGDVDPHFWLDPTRLASVAEAVSEELAAIDPDNAEVYADRSMELVASLDALDGDLAAGLAQCTDRTVVTSHSAFGYLADRYDLEQVSISGIDPEAEPPPARLREVSDVVRDTGVTTIYFESRASSKVTDVLAADLGVATDVLDPLENLAEGATDYRSVMLENLAALRAGLGCV